MSESSLLPGAQMEPLLAVDLSVMIQFGGPENSGAVRFRSLVRGWKSNAYIIIDLPAMWASLESIRTGLNCVVRFVSEGSVCGFTSALIECDRRAAVPYALLRWPERLEIFKVRQDERLEVEMPCVLQSDGGEPIEGVVRDLSVGGCRVICSAELNVEAACRLSLSFPDGARVEDVEVIVRAQSKAGAGRYSYGLKFVERGQDATAEIGFYALSTLERMRGRQAAKPRLLFSAEDPATLRPLAEYLGERGYEILWANNAIDSFFRMKLTSIDAVILAAALPGISGLDLCRIIRSSGGFESFPVFLAAAQPLAQIPAELRPTEMFGASAPFVSIEGLLERHLKKA